MGMYMGYMGLGVGGGGGGLTIGEFITGALPHGVLFADQADRLAIAGDFTYNNNLLEVPHIGGVVLGAAITPGLFFGPGGAGGTVTLDANSTDLVGSFTIHITDVSQLATLEPVGSFTFGVNYVTLPKIIIYPANKYSAEQLCSVSPGCFVWADGVTLAGFEITFFNGASAIANMSDNRDFIYNYVILQ